MSAKNPKASEPKKTNGKAVSSWKKDVDTIFGYLRNIRKQPVTLQIAVGASGGIITGYLFSKTSRFVAVLTGCSLILLQFFNYRGYLKFNRSQLRKDLDDLQDTVRSELGLANKLSLPSGKELDDFASKNAYLLGGYVAGNMIGYGLG
uniref:FUN14 domain-containing protein 1 n=1 Tax=Ditylenchus dipsaci TaxID=166011 RepID=A0A915DHH3_9BILA